MQQELQDEIEKCLVAGVILTPGNLRGTSNWFGKAELDEVEELRGMGLARVERQLIELEDRARRIDERINDNARHPEDGPSMLLDGLWDGAPSEFRRNRRLRVRCVSGRPADPTVTRRPT